MAATVRSDETGRAASPLSRTAAFFTAIPTFAMFDSVGNPGVFVPLPDDWVIGLSDVVSSTAAIAEGRYKAVNTAGASVISAVSNALGTLDFPFLFSGDGASFAVAPSEKDRAVKALAATTAWVGTHLALTLRGGVVTVAEVRRRGLDVRVARFAASDDATYAMFSGGGLGWIEEELKAGRLPELKAQPGSYPDLTGLSCRFQDLKSKHGVILSILVRPTVAASDPRFTALLADVLRIAGRGPDAGRPIPVFNPLFGVTLRAISYNGRLTRRPGQGRIASWLRSAGASAFVSALFATGIRIGQFVPRRYLAQVVANTDFRKYDDGLMMTVDCDIAVATEIERHLADSEQAGIARFGLHRQAAATLTCVVPAATQANHVHFIDGAAGGYAMAARSLKSPRAPSVDAGAMTS